MSKSKTKKSLKPSKASKKATPDSPNPQEKAIMTALLNEGRFTELEALFKTWTVRFPKYVLGWQALGALLKQLERSPEVLAPIQKKIVELLPEDADAHLHLGNTLLELGQLDQAAYSYRLALEIRPDFAEAYSNLGNILHALGRLDEAGACCRRALEIKPDFAEAHSNLGNNLHALGRLDEAETSCRRALEIKPDFAEAHRNLSVILHDLGRLDEAEASCRRALEIKPDFAEAHSHLGNILKNLLRLAEAEASYRQALEIRPNAADAYNNLSVTLHDLGRLNEAEACCHRALEIRPDFAEAYSNLGNILKNLFRLDEAEANYRRALEIKPDYEVAFSNLLFVLNYHPDKTGEEIFEDYRKYDARFGLPHRSEWQQHNNSRETQRRLKVGYVSPDFKKHPVQHFLEPLLMHHDKDALEIYAYADLMIEDEVTARYKGYVDHWVFTKGLSDAVLAERIRADGIDILVDLAGHTANNRLGVFARKPAPVSVSCLGYGYTTGLTAIDYFLIDEVAVPANSERLFSETPWRLATPGFVYQPAENMGELNPLPAMSAGHVTFGTLSRGVRINHRVIRIWSEILKRVEGSRLVIDSHDFREAYSQEILADKFAAHGISRDQLQIGYHSPPWDVLRGLDIGLDCFPHNSGTTLFETLYIGVPYITLAERPSVGRLGSSILESIGHREWIAITEEDYVEKAVALAGDLPKLAALRTGLRKDMESRPLMDELALARKIEAAYREMFQKWAEKMGAEVVAQPNIEYQHIAKEPLPDSSAGLQNQKKKPKTKSTKSDKSARKAALHKGKNPNPNEVNQLIALFTEGRYTEAAQLAQAMTVRFPLYGFGWKALGAVFRQMGRNAEALAPMQKAAALSPDDAEAHSNLGCTLVNLGRLEEAKTSCLRAIKIKPYADDAHNNLGIALMNLLQQDEAEASFRRALEINPNYKEAFSNLLFTLNYHPDKSGEDIFEDYRKYNARFGLPYRSEWQPHSNSRDMQRRLKVGYVSPDFKKHPVQHFLEPLLAHHDKQAVELYAYADLASEDSVTARYKNYVDHWLPTRGLSDVALAERIRADGIDILLDLAGHSANNRLGVFARKPAPVSVSLFGYGYSTGLTAIDYYLADEASAPPGCEMVFSERPWRIENPPCAYRPAEGMGEVNALPALERGYVTFGTLTRAVRINYRTLRVWAELLKRVPRSRLVIDSRDFQYPAMQEQLAEKFAALGIDREQLEIGCHSPPWDTLRKIDIGLDCFPHNSGTTLFENLYMGLPFVTLAGRPSVGCLGKAVLKGLGRPEWVAGSEDEYIEIAAELASDLGRLAQLRAGLRDEMRTSALMDEPAFARKMENAFREMWAIRCEKGD